MLNRSLIFITCLFLYHHLPGQAKTINIFHTYDKWVPYFDDGMELFPFRLVFPNGDKAFLSRADVFSPPYYIKIERLDKPLLLSVRFAHNLIMRKKAWSYKNVPFYYFDTTLTIYPDSIKSDNLYFVKHEMDSTFSLSISPLDQTSKNKKVMKRSRLYLTYNATTNKTTYKRLTESYQFADGREYWPCYWDKKMFLI